MNNPTQSPSPDNPPQAGLSSKRRVLLVDDHPILVESLTASINTQHDLAVCGSAANARAARQLVITLKPDLVVADVSLDDSHGIELVKDLVAQHPELRVLMLSMHDESLYGERALRAGARGYVMKRDPMQKLLAAMRKVLLGGLSFSESMTDRLLNGYSASALMQKKLPVDRLSDRELEILEMTGRAKKTREIAQALSISMKTVQAHREHIKVKLELADGLALSRFAINWVESGEKDRTPDHG